MVIEDDGAIRDELALILENEGYETVLVTDFEDVTGQVINCAPALVLLDLGLPGRDGMMLCADIRKKTQTPVIIVTSRDSAVDELKALSLGGDDYITKPYNVPVLLARVRTVLRRCGGSSPMLTCQELCIDTGRGLVTKGSQEVILSALEYRLLLYFFNNRGHILSRNQLLEEIWDVAGEFVNDNTLTVYIKRIREKIEDDPASPRFIKTVRGLGYRMD